MINRGQSQQVERYCYLGNLVTEDIRCHNEIIGCHWTKRSIEMKSQEIPEDAYDQTNYTDNKYVSINDLDNEFRHE